MKTVSVLGSTGSIGCQTLDVCRRQGFKVSALASGGSNIALLAEQVGEFLPEFVSVADESAAERLRAVLAGSGIEVLGGKKAVLKAAEAGDIVLNAVTGIAGLAPSISAIASGRTLALANKETLVAGGRRVMEFAAEMGVRVLPVDSEHSAIFQCLQAPGDHGRIQKLILTASGGPFFGRTGSELEAVTPKEALAHPTWNMGQKVTIDSATMVNKGLEIIEAALLFDIPAEDIEVVVHRQSIVHSLVEFRDNSVLAQLGAPDMRTPIQYALTWPERAEGAAKRLSLAQTGRLDFAAVDEDTFPATRLARRAFQTGGTTPAAFNAADEAAVAAFLAGRIKFTDITDIIEKTLDVGIPGGDYSFEDVFETDREAGQFAEKLINRR